MSYYDDYVQQQGGRNPMEDMDAFWNRPQFNRGDRPQSPGYQPWSGGGGGDGFSYDPWGGGGSSGGSSRGSGRSGSAQRPSFAGWDGGAGFNTPGMWEAPDIDIPEAGVDTDAIVESRRHWLDETMGGEMGDAARMMGAAGIGLENTDYVSTLGAAVGKRDRDLAAEYYGWDFKASQADADRASRARENELDRSLSAWGTHGGWDTQGQMFGLGQEFDAWNSENDWNMDLYGTDREYDFRSDEASSDRDFNAWNQQGQWAYGDYMNQQGQDYDAWSSRNNWNLGMYDRARDDYGADWQQTMDMYSGYLGAQPWRY